MSTYARIRWCGVILAGAALGIGATEAARAQDAWLTTVDPSPTSVTFGGPEIPPIPADFFGPGSQPFSGVIIFGSGTGAVDTIIRRFGGPFLADPPGTQDVIPIEMIQLDLVSVNPITVIISGNPTEWDVKVDLPPSPPQPQGQMHFEKTHPNGGTFDAILPVIPRFTFNQVGNPSNERVIPSAGPLQLRIGVTPDPPAHWVHQSHPVVNAMSPPGSVFVPGIREQSPGNPASQVRVPFRGISPNGGVEHHVWPPFGMSPIPTVTEWGLIVTGLGVLISATVLMRQMRRRMLTAAR